MTIRDVARTHLQEASQTIDRINSAPMAANDNRAPFHVKLLTVFSFAIIFVAVMGWLP